MSDPEDVTPREAPKAAVRALRRFAAAHGGSAGAVVEHLGERGARVVVVGVDGAWGDQVVPSVEEGRLACEAAGLAVQDGWDRELSGAVRTGGYEWGRMARGRPTAGGGTR
jgi:hypothetical protein